MELREEEIDLIEKYLANNASPEELSIFESKLQEEPNFAARVALFKSINENKATDSSAFENLLDDLHEEYKNGEQETQAAPIKRLTPYYYIAASVILFIVGYFVLSTNSKIQSGPNLYAQYFTLPPENITTRDSGELNNYLVVAIDAYRKQNFNKAIQNFNSYLSEDPENDAANFYLGISYLANEQTELSTSYLIKVVNNQDSIYRNAAQWYLSMAYLQSDNIDKAKSALEKINAGSSSYAKKANKILEKLPEK